ncbi:3'(2'),5'-bisphosphate nucleotidase CysQ [Flammeovirgaceae bacterium SG7u.111]|nr:3'(2'),5'-bisphosphate nucleotidase CysQ [Flammeovirgaceae bacterium SG7u.132]WPO38474.1 3'(2'),5'-bisphosphate nucleotidase CysQ [Flammeovirgaceae bacterium SG7u.111]
MLIQDELVEKVKAIAVEAGKAIMDVYVDPVLSQKTELKSDYSPLTLADKRAHDIIVKALGELTPDIPLISEEGKDIPYEDRKDWDQFWLVDPLDGTREFVKRNGEFTVNIALLENKIPVLGVIYVPVTEVMYVGVVGQKASKIVGEEQEEIKINNLPSPKVAVRSKSHASDSEEALFDKLGVTEFTSVGSSLKFCMVAEGKADIYYRHNPTMEWDTAAGQAVLMAAGGQVYVGDSIETVFSYNKENLLNSGFLGVGYQH